MPGFIPRHTYRNLTIAGTCGKIEGMRVPAVLMVVLMAAAGCAVGAPGSRPAEHPLNTPPTSTGDVVAVGTVELPAAVPVSPDPRIGAVFVGDTQLHSCTGSVLDSPGGDLVLTAAHCLADGVPAQFVPAFSDASADAQVWSIDDVYLDPRWSASQDQRADYAIVRVSDSAGERIESRVGGGLHIGTPPAANTAVRVIGYPMGVGGGPVSCAGPTGAAQDGYPSLPCDGMVGGTSGAPWLAGSTIVGIVGGLDGGGCREDASFSPPFDASMHAVLARAEAGPGDQAPASFGSDDC